MSMTVCNSVSHDMFPICLILLYKYTFLPCRFSLFLLIFLPVPFYCLVLPTTASVPMEGLKEYFLLVSSLFPMAAAWPEQRLMERQLLELAPDFSALVGLRLELVVSGTVT